jgi:hypothetical protein
MGDDELAELFKQKRVFVLHMLLVLVESAYVALHALPLCLELAEAPPQHLLPLLLLDLQPQRLVSRLVAFLILLYFQ